MIAKTDKRRVNYYNFYTGQKWGKFDNYHLSIDSSLLGVEGSAQMIADIARIYLARAEQE
jgi:cytidylate kinase